MNIPTWLWYVAAIGIFVLGYLYISSQNQSSNPIGGTVSIPSSQELGNYNGSADILASVLQMQSQEIQHIAGNQPPTTQSK